MAKLEQIPATRKLANRDRGVLETKLVNLTKEIYQDFILNKAILVIPAKWPS